MGAAFLGGKICGEGGGPVVRMVWGEFAEGAGARRASRHRRLRRGAPASAEPKRPAGVFGLRCGVPRGDGSVGFLLTMTLFAVIMELHSTKKERIP